MAVSEIGRIARKSERITFQKNAVTSDRYRNRIHQWQDYFSCNAYAGTYARSEDGDKVISDERNVTFETRWCPELAAVTSTGYRIVFNDETYNILSVDLMNYQRKTIKFSCQKDKRQNG